MGESLAPGEALSSDITGFPSPSDSDPEAEVLSDGEWDFLSCFSSFLLFRFLFLAACFLCFLVLPSPSTSIGSVIKSFVPSPLASATSPEAGATGRAFLMLALVLMARGGSGSDSGADSELLSRSPFRFFFFFLLLCFLCFLFFLWGVSLPSLADFSSKERSFSFMSSSPG